MMLLLELSCRAFWLEKQVSPATDEARESALSNTIKRSRVTTGDFQLAASKK